MTPNFHDCPLLEGIVTTVGENGGVHVAAMGPRVDWPVTTLQLRPFQTATTFANLFRTRRGVLHVVDDVLLLARAAIGRLMEPPPMVESIAGYPPRLADCVRWYAFEVDSIDDSRERSEMVCRVQGEGHAGDFFGLHRARHAVVEAAIMATRLDLLPLDQVLDRYGEFATIVEKTAGPAERQAFAELQQFLNEKMSEGDTRTMFDS